MTMSRSAFIGSFCGRPNASRNLALAFVALVILITTMQFDSFKISNNVPGFLFGQWLFKPRLENSKLWINSTRGVVNCRTGSKFRQLPKLRSMDELNAGIRIENADNLTSPETALQRQQAFAEIFNKKLWHGQEKPTGGSENIIGSGPGSTLKNTINIRATLDIVVSQVKTILGKSVITMLDIPCGDLTWMSRFMANRTDVLYTGMDIVPDIISHHSRVYTPRHPHMTFINQDVAAKPLPRAFDLIHTRQMTQHLSSEDTVKVLNHFKKSGSHFVVATTVPGAGDTKLNLKRAGRHRLQDLEGTPINLPPPVCMVQDVSVEHNALWILNL